jgi:hypothetical protein
LIDDNGDGDDDEAGNDNEAEAWLSIGGKNGEDVLRLSTSTFSDDPCARAYADRGCRVLRNPCHIPGRGTCALKE